MSVGVTVAAAPGTGNAVDTLIDLAREAKNLGVPSIWFAQLSEQDALMTAALAGREVPGIDVGTSVVPIYPRHPITLASQALTVQAATHGRFTLGIGLSSKMFVNMVYGMPWDRPIRHLREYLEALHSLLHNGTSNVAGETLTARTMLPANVRGAGPVPVIVAAMGPQALKAAGELADGTMPFLASPKVLADYLVPTITRSAVAKQLRVIAIVPALVTSNPDEAKQAAVPVMGMYNQMPYYRAVMERGGVSDAVELGVFGDEETVAAEVRQYFDAGATDVLISHQGLGTAEDQRRTWRLAGELHATLRA